MVRTTAAQPPAGRPRRADARRKGDDVAQPGDECGTGLGRFQVGLGLGQEVGHRVLELTNAITPAAEETPDDPELADRLLTLTLRGLKP